jgi:hypothetical protein
MSDEKRPESIDILKESCAAKKTAHDSEHFPGGPVHIKTGIGEGKGLAKREGLGSAAIHIESEEDGGRSRWTSRVGEIRCRDLASVCC